MSQLSTASIMHLMIEDSDPAKEILDAVGDLSDIELTEDLVLVGIYIQQGKTKGGLITTQLSIESVYQGKVGLVLKLPPQGLTEREHKAWGGADKLPKVGDWVYFKADDGMSMSVHGTGGKRSERLQDLGINIDGWPCRMFEAKYILGRVKEPRSIV